MMEVYVLVERKKNPLIVFASILGMVLGGLLFLLSCYSPFFFPFGIALALVGFAMIFFLNKEYEYSYFDGEVRFAKIMNKSRRKRLRVLSMDEVIVLAPAGDRSVYKYENDRMVKVIDYTSGKKGCPCYDMVAAKGNSCIMIQFEPDEKYLDAVCVKYGQKVVRKKGQ